MYAALLRGDLSGTDELTVSQQMLQILMDSMTNAVFWKDVDSRYLGCNQVFADFAGFEPTLLLGKSDRDMPWTDDPEYNSDWFIEWDQAVLTSDEPQFGILERLRRADGELRWLETNKVPLRDLDGEVIGVLGTFEDITDRRHAEEELQQALEELDERVHLRTTELMRANATLRREVEDRIRLQTEERQQRAYAEALRDTAAAMSRTFDLDDVTEQTLTGVERLVSNDLAAVILTNPDGTCQLSRHNAGFGYISEPAEVDEIDVETLTILERLKKDSGSVIIERPPIALGPAGSVLGATMQVAGQFVGVLIVESATPGFFSADHADRLAAVADQAGPVLSNSRLASRVSELAAAEERQRLARDLHDAVNQTLWTAALTAESLLDDIGSESPLRYRVDRLRQLTRGALAEMRSLLLELRPAELVEVNLGELIGHLIDALECRRTVDVTVDLDPVGMEPIAHIAFYRIAQEGLRNVAKHAGAASLRVRLSEGPPVELSIVDDGCGFDPDDVPAGRLGLMIMQERAESIGASLVVDASPGSGTALLLRAES
jgi:two-component system nitrate/nitrite sensor histidine kinase NarX